VVVDIKKQLRVERRRDNPSCDLLRQLRPCCNVNPIRFSLPAKPPTLPAEFAWRLPAAPHRWLALRIARNKLIRNILLGVLALLLLPYLLTLFYAGGHPVSTLMVGRWLTGAPVVRQWLDLDQMSPALPRSVVGAEDAKFCTHHGIDWDSVREVIDDLQDGEAARGGSTITQQVAKNLFLWPGRSVIRKALEAPLALWIDLVLSKQRVLEIYLNIAEWGPEGQFGAEAGAQYAFGESAGRISAREAALMASILPNPKTRSARNPGPGVRRLASTYAARGKSAELGRCWGEGRD
jgi:monofunctional biosynthetic peptidoglycan transglycosylase